MNRREFESAIEAAPNAHERLAWFGALLAQESKLGDRLRVVGGSAIEVYLTSDRYVSGDIDIVGHRDALTPILKRWGFGRELGRDRREYWVKEGLGLVDLVGDDDRSGLPARPYPTPYGEVSLAPVEALIVRRLMRASREKSDEMFRQASALAISYGRRLDWDYIATEAKFEKVTPLLDLLRKAVAGRR